MNHNSEMSTEQRFRGFQQKILLVFIAGIIILAGFLSVVILNMASNVLREKVSYLVSADSRQLQLNINSYLEKVESTAALLFADEEYYTYDATNGQIDEYDRIKMEEAISNRIVDLGLMENYSDFCIIYPDDNKVGWMSKTTAGAYVDGGIYKAFADLLNGKENGETWCWNICDNMDRMYYVKRLNPNAVLVTSFYIRELENVFEVPEELQDMIICLVNDNNEILYSSQDNLIGTVLNEKIATLISENGNSINLSGEYLVNSNVCENGWRVVCYVPETVILKEMYSLRRYTILFSIVISVLFITIGLLTIRRIAKPVDGMVSNLEHKAVYDQLSGLLNKDAYTEKVTNALRNASDGQTSIFLMLDMDNFKQINDRAGHLYGDEVIVRMGQVLRNYFSANSLVGRIGGDEFSAYITIEGNTQNEISRNIKDITEKLMDEFDKEFQVENETYSTSVSIGVCVSRNKESTFDVLYQKADEALYQSKSNGKHTYTVKEEKE